MELSGFYGYDVQWAGTDDSTNKWSYRHVLFDLINNEPVAEEITSDESSATTYDFINKNTLRRERIAIVTDLKPGYEKIMRELGFEHQYCIFHLQLNIKDKIKQYFRTKEQKHKSKIKKEHPTWSKFKIKKETKKHFKEEKHEINNYLKFFMKLFECETYKEALEYIELIKQELNNFPPVLKEYLTKNFLPEYKKYIVFLKDEFKGKLDRTNNKTENYIGNTLPKAHKNKFRTNQGLFDQIYLRSIRWKKNQRNQLTN